MTYGEYFENSDYFDQYCIDYGKFRIHKVQDKEYRKRLAVDIENREKCKIENRLEELKTMVNSEYIKSKMESTQKDSRYILKIRRKNKIIIG